MFFDEGDAGAESRRANGRDQAGSASANHHQVIGVARRWIHPGGRVGIGHQADIVCIDRQHVDGVGLFVLSDCNSHGLFPSWCQEC